LHFVLAKFCNFIEITEWIDLISGPYLIYKNKREIGERWQKKSIVNIVIKDERLETYYL